MDTIDKVVTRVMVFTIAERNGEFELMTQSGLKQLHAYSTGWCVGFQVWNPQTAWWDNVDGTTVDGWLLQHNNKLLGVE
jgi:beta-lactamase class D